MRTRHARAIRKGILLAQSGDRVAAVELPNTKEGRLAWAAYFQTVQLQMTRSRGILRSTKRLTP